MSEQIQVANSLQNLEESSAFSEFKLTETSIEEGVNDICVTRQQNAFKHMQSFAIKTICPSNFLLKHITEQQLLKNNCQIKILLADDNPFNILVLESYLNKIKEFDFKILTVNNGQEALDAFEENNKTQGKENIDIIVLDCDMPIMNGFQSAQKIQELVEKSSFIKADIVGYTCFEGDKEKCLRSGMNKFLSKPATEQSFTSFIVDIFRKKLNNQQYKK